MILDATYRGELRELNEIKYARFEAKFEQRMAELRSELIARIDGIQLRLDGKLDTAVAEHAFAQLNARIDRSVAEMDARLERGLKEQTRWLLLAWGTVLAGVIGLWVRG